MQFLLTYRVPKTRLQDVLGELEEKQRVARVNAWNGWFDTMGDAVVERGNPVNDARAVGNCGPDMRIGGYSIIDVDTLDTAVELAQGCPGVEWGGGVEIGELLQTPLDPGALRSKVAAR